MKIPVTDAGVTLPRSWFGDAVEVDALQENGHVRVVPLAPAGGASKHIQPYDPDDPIWQFGKNPVDLGITDGSINHDRYLYGNPHGHEL